MRKSSAPIVTMLAALTVAVGGCGGGGGTPAPVPTPTPAPTNALPVFTSATAVNLPENQSTVFYTARATDSNGDPITYSITGGADQGVFRISASGELRYVFGPSEEPANFEAPRDADRNNIYEVIITASDGKGTTNLTLSVTVTDLEDSFATVKQVNSWSTRILQLTPHPTVADGISVLMQGDFLGYFNHIMRGGSSSFLTPPSGAISFVWARDAETSQQYYVLARTNGRVSVRRGRERDPSRPVVDDIVLDIPEPSTGTLTGWLGFGADGFLYVLLGDGNPDGSTDATAADPNSLYGKILRIDPRSDAYPGDPSRNYSIPAGNPFATAGGRPEIWASGVHRPKAVRFDTNGDLVFIDSGNLREEVNLLTANTAGLNFGWPYRDGTQTIAPPPGAVSFTAPVAEYAHGNGALQGNSIVAGVVYRGAVTQLAGRYIFSDATSAAVYSIPRSRLVVGQTVAASDFEVRTEELRVVPGNRKFLPLSAIGLDGTGTLYFAEDTTPFPLYAIVPR